MIFFESPTNPLLKIADIKAISQRVKATRPDIYIVVDNTFATSYFQVTTNFLNILIQLSMIIMITITNYYTITIDDPEAVGAWCRYSHVFFIEIHERSSGCDHGRSYN